jgi:hypothetical protein
LEDVVSDACEAGAGGGVGRWRLECDAGGSGRASASPLGGSQLIDYQRRRRALENWSIDEPSSPKELMKAQPRKSGSLGEASRVELISGPRLAGPPDEGRRSRSRAADFETRLDASPVARGLTNGPTRTSFCSPAVRPGSIHPIQDHVRSRQEGLGTPANYAWEFGRTRCSAVPQPPSITGGRSCCCDADR